MCAAAVRFVEALEEEGKLAKKDIIRILVVDDEEGFRQSTKDNFEQLGYSVDEAATPEQAKSLLEKRQYQIVIADINFDPPHKSGDQFIIENIELMRRAKKIAITGQGTELIKRKAELKNLGVIILEKGDHGDELEQITEEKFLERKNAINEELRQHLDSLIDDEDPLPGGIIEAATDLRQMLINYLKSRENPDMQSILYGGRAYSTNEIAREIEKDSEIGQAHLKMMVKLFSKHYEFSL